MLYSLAVSDLVVQIAIHLRAHGLRGYLLRVETASEAMYSWGTIFCLCVALLGVKPARDPMYLHHTAFG